MVTLGPPGAGKSSTVETLRNEKPHCVDKKTEVADLRQLDISPTDSIQVFDEGGDDVYQITSPIFNTPKSIPMLVHNMTKVDGVLTTTADIFRQNLMLHPENQVVVVLTHIDQCDDITRQQNKEAIMSRLIRVIDQELQVMKDYRTGEEGKQKRIIEDLEKQKAGLECFPISCETYEGVKELREYLKTIVESRRVVLPASWLEFYKAMMKQHCSFFTKAVLQGLYVSLTEEDQESQFLQALLYFSDVGLILYYNTVAGLNQYIFHRPQLVIDVLKSVFNHRVSDILDYDQNELLSKRFTRAHLKVLADRFQNEGLLDVRLLDSLWEQYNLQNEDKGALQKLMETFHLCYPISKTSTLLFFPWFVVSKAPPSSIDLNNMSRFSDKQMSVQFDCKFVPCIPVNVFEIMIVELQKTVSNQSYVGERFAWKDGLHVKMETIEMVLTRNELANKISLCVSSDACDVETLWEVSTNTEVHVQSTLEQYNGIDAELVYVCGHCLLMRKSLPCYHRPERVLRSTHRAKFVTCGDDKIPAALVRAVPDAREHVQSIEKYLQENFKATRPPRLPYVDCLQMSGDEFQLSWTWPSPVGGVTGVILEVAAGSGEWRQIGIIKRMKYQYKGHATSFRAAAVIDEERGDFLEVKPVSGLLDDILSPEDDVTMQTTLEIFSGMTNIQLVSTRLLTRGAIKREAFESINGKFRPGDEEASVHAANTLMQWVFRMTYKKLYFFKKTLKETGQPTLADNVIVRLEDGSELDLDDV